MKHAIAAFLFLTFAHAASAIGFDSDGFADSLGGWENEKNATIKYEWSGSDFRTHRPVVTRTPEGGLFVTAQVYTASAISSDVCVLEMTFNRSGKLIASQAKIRMGRHAYDTQLVKPEPPAPKAPSEEGAPPAPTPPPLSEQIATELFKKLDTEVAKWNDTLTGAKVRRDLIGRIRQKTRSGQNVRVNFSGAVRHNFNLIASHVGYGFGRTGK